MFKTSDMDGLTGNVETFYSRHMTYSAFLLGSPTFNGVTSSKLTPACCERTALHFCHTLSLHFRPSAVSYTFLSLAYVYPSFFRAHAALKEQNFIFIHSPFSGWMQQSLCSFLQFFTIKASSW